MKHPDGAWWGVWGSTQHSWGSRCPALPQPSPQGGWAPASTLHAAVLSRWWLREEAEFESQRPLAGVNLTLAKICPALCEFENQV